MKTVKIRHRKALFQSHIMYILADINYIQIFTIDNSYRIACCLKKFLIKLDQESFLRINRSIAININFIENVEIIEAEIYLKSRASFKISRRYLPRVINKLNSTN